MYVALGCTQVRVPHKFRHAEYIYSRFDGTGAISVAKIEKPDWRLNSAFPQRPEISRLKLLHRSRPVESISSPTRKQILAFRVEKPAVEHRKSPRGDWNIPTHAIR